MCVCMCVCVCVCVCARTCAGCTNLSLLFVVLTATAVTVHSILGGQLALQLLRGLLLWMTLVVEVLLQLEREREGERERKMMHSVNKFIYTV